MSEIDISQSTDGSFFIFHDGGEERLLAETRNIKQLSDKEIESKRYFNSLSEQIDKRVETFDYLYNHIDHQTFLNIDRSWDYWETFLPFLDKYVEMHEYFVLKSPPKREYLQLLNDHPIKYLYFPIIENTEQLEILKEFPELNIVGIEVIESSLDFQLINSESMDHYLNGPYMILANSIKLNSTVNLFSGLDDNLALLDGTDKSWDKILSSGVNAIQTDWPDILNDYRIKL